MPALRFLQAALSIAVAVVSIGRIECAEGPQAVALLIGNSSYERQLLASPPNDINVVGAALERIGFRTTVAEDLDLDGLRKTVGEFARTAPTTSIVLVYLAGEVVHGNWKDARGKEQPAVFLRPLKATFRNHNEIRSRCLAVPEVLRTISEQSGARHCLVLVDGVRTETDRDSENDSSSATPAVKSLPPDALLAITIRRFKADGNVDRLSPLARSLRQGLSTGRGDVFRAVADAYRAVPESADKSPLIQSSATSAVAVPQSETPMLDAAILEKGQAGSQLVNSIGQVYCWCPPGAFRMGSPTDEANRSYDEEPVDVRIPRGFWMSRYEVTEREYRLATKRSPRGPRGKNYPMTEMRSGDARRFADSLTKMEQAAGRLPKDWAYAIPSEAEWEYACRAGTRTPFSFGSDAAELPAYGNFADRTLLAFNDSDFRYASRDLDDGFSLSAPVGSLRSNPWGLCDMHGNVWEWCADAYQEKLAGGVDPRGPVKGTDRGRVIRGGSWLSHAHYCRSAMRQAQHDLSGATHIGIRIVLKRIPVQSSKSRSSR